VRPVSKKILGVCGQTSTDPQEMQRLSGQVFGMQDEEWIDGALGNE